MNINIKENITVRELRKLLFDYDYGTRKVNLLRKELFDVAEQDEPSTAEQIAAAKDAIRLAIFAMGPSENFGPND